MPTRQLGVIKRRHNLERLRAKKPSRADSMLVSSCGECYYCGSARIEMWSDRRLAAIRRPQPWLAAGATLISRFGAVGPILDVAQELALLRQAAFRRKRAALCCTMVVCRFRAPFVASLHLCADSFRGIGAHLLPLFDTVPNESREEIW